MIEHLRVQIGGEDIHARVRLVDHVPVSLAERLRAEESYRLTALAQPTVAEHGFIIDVQREGFLICHGSLLTSRSGTGSGFAGQLLCIPSI